MDPLSFTANIIAILSTVKAAVQALEKLKDLLHAPEQLLQTLNEVSDFQAILVTVREIANQLHVLDLDSSFVLRIKNLIEDSADLITKLLDTVQLCIKFHGPVYGSEFDVSRKTWLRKQSKIQRLALELRSKREDISNLLVVVSASEVLGIRVDLDHISFIAQDLRRQMKEYAESSSRMLKALSGSLTTIKPQLADLEASARNWHNRRVSSEVNSFSKVRRPPYSHEAPSNTTQASNNVTNIQIKATLYRQAICDSRCLCRCHRMHITKTPKFLGQLIGSLFIGYSNTPFNRTPCNEKRCRQQRSSLLKVNYYFPSWFMYRMIAFKNVWDPTQGHQISVRTPRLVSHSADVILIVDHGNLDSLKTLFVRGMASPFDVSSKTGQTLLQSAISKKRIDFCEFLLAQYADPEIEDMQNTSPINMIWDMWLKDDTNSTTQALIKVFSSRLDASSDLQKRDFTILHQIILRLNPLDLKTSLQLSTSTINSRCSKGCTPLSWAIMRDQPNDVRLLIEYGADLTLANKRRETPLHLACANSSTNCLELLLSALFSSTSSQPKVDLNPTTIFGYTPLHIAIFAHNTAPAKLLFERCNPLEVTHMIDLSIESYSSAALQISLQINSHYFLEMLLALGAKTDGIDALGLNILHLIAVCGDLQSIRILLNAALEGGVRGSSVEARDSYGYTPLEDFDIVRRKYVDEDEMTFQASRELFLSLLEKVSSAPDERDNKKESDDSGVLENEEDEEFFDVEYFGG